MKCCTLLAVLLLASVRGQEDSLRSALDAFDRRQEEFPAQQRYGEDGDYGYALERPDDLAFIKDYSPDKGSYYNQALSDYLEDQDQDDMKKRIYSSFRERMEEDKQKQMNQDDNVVVAADDDGIVAAAAEDNEDDDDIYDNLSDDEYELLRKLWEKYRRMRQPYLYISERNKRYYYPQFGLGESVGLRKRSRIYPDSEGYGYRERNWGQLRPYVYQQMKRFPVTKRSSDFGQKDEARKETDPKVAKELSSVFGVKSDAPKSTTTTTTTTTSTTTTTAKPTKGGKKKVASKGKEDKPKRPEETKEVAPAAVAGDDKPLQIKKKSINWSDYWGLDRRKKSGGSDNEWLLERYHKAIAMAAKRNAQMVQQGKKQDAPEMRSDEERRIDDMDDKLKTMEDTIVDDALKYTGAHEGATDSKEVQAVKNRVISRLAAAYSLEKMRNALGEYKMAVAKERERLKLQKSKDQSAQADKRTSVPRKEAVDERAKNQESDNKIKCLDDNTEECLEQMGSSTELMERLFGQDQCPMIEKACNELSMILGHNGNKFEKACNMYEMCLLCTNNFGTSPVHHCNSLFLSKANELCTADDRCRKEAKRSLRLMLDVNTFLQADAATQEQCETHCPNMETISELLVLR